MYTNYRMVDEISTKSQNLFSHESKSGVDNDYEDNDNDIHRSAPLTRKNGKKKTGSYDFCQSNEPTTVVPRQPSRPSKCAHRTHWSSF